MSYEAALKEICDELESKGRNLDNCVVSIRALQKRAAEITAPPAPDFAGLVKRCEAAEAERDALRKFAQCIMEDSADSDLDGGTLQDAAERYGLLKSVPVAKACGEACVCAEYGDFPQDCYRRTSLLTGNPKSDAAIDGAVAAT